VYSYQGNVTPGTNNFVGVVVDGGGIGNQVTSTQNGTGNQASINVNSTNYNTVSVTQTGVNNIAYQHVH
jgi:hypothetical protein